MRVYVSKDNVTTQSSYVGSPGELTIDPSTLTIKVHDGITAGGVAIGSGSNVSVGSFGFDSGTSYNQNDPAVMYSADDMLIRTGGTASGGGENYGQIQIASSEETYIGQADNLADSTSPTYNTYLYLDSTSIQLNNNGNTWTFNSSGTTQFPNYTFPYTHGTAGQVLADDGNGTLSWQNNAGATGPQGNIGPTGPAGADSTVTGPTGPAGMDGATGPQGGPLTISTLNNGSANTQVSLDNLNVQVANLGGSNNQLQISPVSGSLGVLCETTEMLFGNSIGHNSGISGVAGGTVMNAGTWYFVGGSNYMTKEGDVIVAYITDYGNNRMYRVTAQLRTASGYAMIAIERLI